MEEPLGCLRRIDFDWIRQIDSVWEPHSAHVEGVHEAVLDAVVNEVERMVGSKTDYSPLGQLVLGYPGAGKTHLLGVLLQLIKDKSYFVMVDMTDVSDFWSSVRLGYLDSLQRSTNGKLQYHRMLEQLLGRIKGVANPEKTRLGLARLEDDDRIAGYINKILLGPLWERFPREIQKYRDLLTALFLLNSKRYDVSSIGYSWLQGIELEPESLKTYDFKQSGADATLVVEGLAWVMSLSRPTLLAFDQLDAIVAQNQALKAEGSVSLSEQQASGKIIHQVAGGLMDVQGLTQRTLPLVCCLHRTWEILESHGVRSFSDRFRLPAHILTPLKSQVIGQKLVRQRVSTSLAGMSLPDPDWPFEPGVFESMPRLMPRELLRLCDAARRRVIAEDSFSRLNPFDADVLSDADETRPNDEQLDTLPKSMQGHQTGSEAQTEALPQNTKPASLIDPELLDRIDAAYEDFQQQADVAALFAEHKEDSLVGEILQAACRCLLIEHPASRNHRIVIDEDFGHGRHAKVLHARLRLVEALEGEALEGEAFVGDRNEEDFSAQEQHFAFRALLQSNPKTFISRLTGAILAAGIDEQLSFRHLVVIRPNDVPRTRNCVALWKEFVRRGGVCIKPDEQLWRRMYALSELERAVPPGFSHWLSSRKPASGLSVFAESGILPLIEKRLAGDQANSSFGQSIQGVKDVGQKTSQEADQETVTDIEMSSMKPSVDPESVEPGHALPSRKASGLSENVQMDDQNTEFSALEVETFSEGAQTESGLMPEQVTDKAGTVGLSVSHNDYFGDVPVSLYAGLTPSETLIFGKRPDQSGSTDFVGFSFDSLLQHTAVLAAKGTGKTNLLIRMVEEASLSGLPAIVLESAGAFACLGEPRAEWVDYSWPGDAERARLCFHRLNINCWTPFNSEGRELPLASIGELVKYLPELAELVTELLADQKFEEVDPPLPKAPRWSAVDGERANVDLVHLPALDRDSRHPPGDGTPAELRGVDAVHPPERPAVVLLRILLSLMADLHSGMTGQGPASPQQAPADETQAGTVGALKALVFIDDAQPFLMNQEDEKLFQLILAYAAHYGIGLVISSDDPGLMSEERTPMFGNWILGKGSSPEQIQTIQSLIRERGAIGHDVPWLQKGEFYCFSPDFSEAVRTQVPAALSSRESGMSSEDFIHKAGAQDKAVDEKQIGKNRHDESPVTAAALAAATGTAIVDWDVSESEEPDIIDIQW